MLEFQIQISNISQHTQVFRDDVKYRPALLKEFTAAALTNQAMLIPDACGIILPLVLCFKHLSKDLQKPVEKKERAINNKKEA